MHECKWVLNHVCTWLIEIVRLTHQAALINRSSKPPAIVADGPRVLRSEVHSLRSIYVSSAIGAVLPTHVKSFMSSLAMPLLMPPQLCTPSNDSSPIAAVNAMLHITHWLCIVIAFHICIVIALHFLCITWCIVIALQRHCIALLHCHCIALCMVIALHCASSLCIVIDYALSLHCIFFALHGALSLHCNVTALHCALSLHCNVIALCCCIVVALHCALCIAHCTLQRDWLSFVIALYCASSVHRGLHCQCIAL